MQSWRQEPRGFALLAVPTIAWLLLLFVVPLGIVWLYSFGENRSLTEIAISGTFKNYGRAFSPLYLNIFAKSVWMATATTFICLILAFPVALAMSFASARGRAWLLMLIMLPFWTNLLIRTYALIAVLGENGFLNALLAWLWRQSHATLALLGFGVVMGDHFEPLKLLYNNFAVIFGLIYVHLPFMVLPLYAALDRLDHSLIEASLDLGAGHLRTLRNIVVPLARPGIMSGILITFVPALGSYLTPDLLGGTDSQFIANVIERQFKSANDWPFGAALSFVLLYATFILIAFQAIGRRKSS